jgi:hypothetical protein
MAQRLSETSWLTYRWRSASPSGRKQRCNRVPTIPGRPSFVHRAAAGRIYSREGDGVAPPNETVGQSPHAKRSPAREGGDARRGGKNGALGLGANKRANTANAMRAYVTRRPSAVSGSAYRCRLSCPSCALIGDDDAGSARIGRPCDIGRIQRTDETAYPTSSSPTAYSRQCDRATEGLRSGLSAGILATS